MTATEFLVLVAAGLAAWGLFTAWLAGRLGEDRFGWWVVGTALGPLSLPALLYSARQGRREVTTREQRPSEQAGEPR